MTMSAPKPLSLSPILFTTCLMAVAVSAQAAMPPEVRKVELRIDVTGSVPLPGKVEIAATAFLPDPKTLGARPVAIFGLPGGGLSRHYFDIHLAGHENYSEAEYHVAHGFIVVAVDHLGVGDSTTTGLDTMHIEDIAAANHAAVKEISQRLVAGTLAPGYPAVPAVFRVGIGQSMGGGITILMQGRHQTYDAIASLGYSAIHTVLPQPTEAGRTKVREAMSANARWSDPQTLRFSTATKADVDYAYVGFWDDVPKDIVDAKLAHGYPQSKDGPNWLSRTVPYCVIAMLSPGFVAEEAAHIDVPVLVGVGERDVVPNPMAEPAAYQSARDVSVFVVPRLGHTHNLGNNRQALWNRIEDWSRAVARSN
jgi:pimeloyl-ACP methyl ester carboxylesterase